MLKLNWKKGIAAALAGIMSFGVLGTTLAVPAEAASHHILGAVVGAVIAKNT